MKTIHYFLITTALCTLLSSTSCTKDFCENSVCLNGGECLNGACECTTGFTGLQCAEQITPAKIRVRTIQVTRFPGMNNGSPWDTAEDGPDLYFRLYEGDTPLAQPRLALSDADENLDYYFFLDIIDLQNVLHQHTLQLRDYDQADDDDILGEVTFTPYHMTNGFPESVMLDNDGSVAFFVEYEYIYKSEIR